jgi:FixJ family two-component response regulator
VKQLPQVFVVDHDAATRSSLEALLTAHGYAVKSFESASTFLHAIDSASEVGCIVIDLSSPEGNNHKVLEWLEESGSLLSVVVTTGLFDSNNELKSKHLVSPPLEIPYEGSIMVKMVSDGIAGSLSRKTVRDRGKQRE